MEQEMQNTEVFENTPDTPEAERVGAQEFPHEPATPAGQEEPGAERDVGVEDFLTRYPHVKPEEIPLQVWQRVMEGESLSLAYALHENALLQSRLEQLQRQEDNRRRTPGALGSQGREPDELERMWAED